MRHLLILLLFISTLANAQVLNVRNVVGPASSSSGSFSTSQNAISGFIATSGSPGTPIFITVSGNLLTSDGLVTAPANFEVSLDSATYSTTKSLSQSSGGLSGQPVFVYLRFTSSAPVGSVSGSLTISSAGAITKSIPLSGFVSSSSPFLTASTNSLGTFATNAGTASTPFKYFLSGFNLTGNGTIVAPSGYEVSLDSTSYGNSKSISQASGTLVNQPVPVFARIAASTSAGSYPGNIINSSTGAGNVLVAVNGTVSSVGGGTVAKFMFGGSSSMNSVPGWTRFFGDNTQSVSKADDATGWILQTYGANWCPFFSIYGSDNGGAESGTWTSTFPQGTTAGYYFNGTCGAWNPTTPNYGFHIDNLPAGDYTIQIIGSVKSTVNSAITTPEYRVKFGSATAQVFKSMNCQDNTQSFLTFTGSITAGQILQISANPPSDLNPGNAVINALIITKN